MWEKAVGDVKYGRALVVPARLARVVRGLSVDPVGVVAEKRKGRIIHDATFSDESTRGKARGRATSERDDVLGLDPGVPLGRRKAQDRAEYPGAER